MPFSASLREKLRQGGTAAKRPMPADEGIVDVLPLLFGSGGGIREPARPCCWPIAGLAVVIISPCEDLGEREPWPRSSVYPRSCLATSHPMMVLDIVMTRSIRRIPLASGARSWTCTSGLRVIAPTIVHEGTLARPRGIDLNYRL
jgi:hypothetical protein